MVKRIQYGIWVFGWITMVLPGLQESSYAQSPLMDVTPTTLPTMEVNHLILDSGTILVRQADRLFMLDPMTLSQKLYLELDPEPETVVGDIEFSPDRCYLYYTVFDATRDTSPSASQLVKLDLTTNTEEVLLSDSRLTRISPVSPGGGYILVGMVDMVNVADSFFCLMDIESSDCSPMGDYIGFGNFFWISDNEFVGTLRNTVEVDKAQITHLRTIEIAGDYFLEAATLTLDGQNLVWIAAQPREDGYVSKFISIDVGSGDIVELHYTIEGVQAASNKIQFSPNGNYVAITYAHHLNILDLESGDVVAQAENVLRFVWTPTCTNLLVVLDDEMPSTPLQLSRFDLSTQEFAASVDFTEDVTLLIVP